MYIQRYLKACVFGFLAAVAGSIVVSLLISLSAGYLEYPLDPLPWLLSVSIGPSVLAALVLCRLAKRFGSSRRRLWFAALLSAIATVILAGSIGSVVVEAINIGYPRVNVTGYLTWSVAYAIGLLPISLPIALLVSYMISRDEESSMHT